MLGASPPGALMLASAGAPLLSGTVSAGSAPSGALGARQWLSGTLACICAPSGSLQTVPYLTGETDASAQAAGVLSTTGVLSGQATSVAQITAALTAPTSLAGSSLAGCSLAGVLSAGAPAAVLSGAAAANALLSASLSASALLTAAASATASAYGTVYVPTPPQIAAASTADWGTGGAVTSLALAVPAHLQGDRLVALVATLGSTGAVGISPTAGWNALGVAQTVGTLTYQAFARTAAASEPSSYTWTFASSCYPSAIGLTVTATSGIESFAYATATGTLSQIQAPSLTASQAEELILSCAAVSAPGKSGGAPPPLTLSYPDGVHAAAQDQTPGIPSAKLPPVALSSAAASRAQAVPGATGTVAVSFPAETGVQAIALSVALKAAGVPVSGQALATSSVGGALGVGGTPVSGSVSSTSTLLGSLGVSHWLSGQAASSLSVSGALRSRALLTASIASNSTMQGAVMTPPPPAQIAQLLIRERPPLRLTLDITTPAGYHQRWGTDDPNPANAPGAITFSSTIPGGFEQANITLQRSPRRSYPDLEELSMVTILGAGGQVAWQGRIEQVPNVGGEQSQINPQCTGYQSHLDDDNSAREIFVDRSITAWQGPSVQRQIQWLKDPRGAVVSTGPSVAPDFSTGSPSLDCQLQGSWSENQVVEGWYDAHGMPIGALFAAWETNGAFTLTGGNAFGAGMFLPTDDTATIYAQINPITWTPGSDTLYATAANAYKFALLQLWNDTVPGGKDGVNYDLFWKELGVYGAGWHDWLLQNGRSLQPDPGSPGGAYGVLASDAVAYTTWRWCPKITFTTGPGGTIAPSAFVLPQLAFLDPTTASAIIKQAVGYELLDWAVWEEPVGTWPAAPCLYLNERGARGNQWRARIGAAQLQETGPQISALWNGVVVRWSDVSGINRTVGPPGSGTNYTDTSLRLLDPENPANQDGINRYALVSMGTSTLAAAIQIGQRFLTEQAQLNTSGQAVLTGYVQDTHGLYWPAWMVRAGDQITFTDSSNPTPRRIVSTNWDDSAKANSIGLDQPPDSLAALLSRLSVSISSIGLS